MKHFRINVVTVLSIPEDHDPIDEVTIEQEDTERYLDIPTTTFRDIVNVFQSNEWITGK